MSLPRGAVGWPAVCDFGISWSHSLIRPELKLIGDSSVVLSCDTNYFRKNCTKPGDTLLKEAENI